MSKFAKISFIYSLIIFSGIFLNLPVAAQISTDQNSDKLSALAGNGIGGGWQLNSAESDDPMQKMQELMQSKVSPSTGAENSNVKQLPPLTTSLFHPDSLILADSVNGDVTINESYKELVQTRTFTPDGKTRSIELTPGADYTVTAIREDGKMTVETVSPRGNKMTETYEVQPGGNKLKVTVRIENAEAKELITLHRTYDRTIIDMFSSDDEMQ